MTQSGSRQKPERPRGVTELPECHGERRYRARIGRGKGVQVNLGTYPTRWLAAFAYNVAAESLYGEGRPRNVVPESEQPTAEQVRAIAGRVRRRLGLGLDVRAATTEERPPDGDRVRTLFEVAVVGFWRDQVALRGANGGRELDLAAARLVDAAQVLFWNPSSGHTDPLEVLGALLGQRLDQAFRRGDLTRAVLDDDGDDLFRLARWLVHPDDLPGDLGFREAVGRLYPDLTGTTSALRWAVVLGIAPPFSAPQVRAAYRDRSKALHPDAGGSAEEFVRLQAAYEEARRFCAARGAG